LAIVNGSISNKVDFGAAFAVAEVFLGAAAGIGGLAAITGFDKETISAFARRFGLTPAFGRTELFFAALTVAATPESAVFVPAFRARLGATFFVAFAVFAFKIFAPVLTRLRAFRLESGFAAAVFFGFFMATILANGARLQLQSTPGIWVAQRLFNFPTAIDAQRRAQSIDAHIHPDFYLNDYE
jgi:hypothetical protein